MRVSIFFSLVAVLTAVGVNAKPTRTTSNLKRFSLKGDLGDENLTPAQRYARELTRRTPTRRATAKKRQESLVDNTPTPQSISLGVSNRDTGSFFGFVDIGPEGLALNGDSGTSFIHLANPTWTITTQQRISTPDTTYPTLGLVQRPGDSTQLGAGLSSAVFIAGVSTTTLPGALPALLLNQVTGAADLAAQTDVWTVDFNNGKMIPIWVNPDGTVATLTVVSNGVSIVATGDADAFNTANGGSWFPISLAFSVAAF